ncbi:MAG: SRPBCC domain-containing protein [Parvularculaceae bacterium]
MPEPKERPILITVSRRYSFPAERVFDAWLDVSLAREFLFATPEGKMITAELDPRVGGKFLFVDRRNEGDAAHYGVFQEIDRPRRIVFSFSAEMYDVNAARVIVEIAPRAEGCELTLTQEMPAKYAEYKDRSEKGWAMILGNLDASLKKRGPR